MARQFRIRLAASTEEEIIEADEYEVEGEMTTFYLDSHSNLGKAKVASFRTVTLMSVRTAPRKVAPEE